MARINERCIEYTPAELKLGNLKIAPGATIQSQLYDLHGAKIHVMWLQATAPGLVVVFEYQTKEREVLQRSDILPIEVMEDGTFNRFQFATYGKMQLPAPYMLMKIKNPTDVEIGIRAYGVSQLQ